MKLTFIILSNATLAVVLILLMSCQTAPRPDPMGDAISKMMLQPVD